MMKQEFEHLALRNNAEIGIEMYKSIERFYTSVNDYKRKFGINGIYENKRDFVKRVFGGKVNTPKTIAEKIIREAIKENRYMLEGCPSATPKALKHMDEAIEEHYMYLFRRGW